MRICQNIFRQINNTIRNCENMSGGWSARFQTFKNSIKNTLRNSILLGGGICPPPSKIWNDVPVEEVKILMQASNMIIFQIIMNNLPSIIIFNSNIKPGTNIITRIKRVRYRFNSCMFGAMLSDDQYLATLMTSVPCSVSYSCRCGTVVAQRSFHCITILFSQF